MVLDEARYPAAQLEAAEDDCGSEHRAEQDADGPADHLEQRAFPRGFRIGQGLAGENRGAGFFVDVDDVGHLRFPSPGGMISEAGARNSAFTNHPMEDSLCLKKNLKLLKNWLRL